MKIPVKAAIKIYVPIKGGKLTPTKFLSIKVS
jgi:hypothetical protein